MASKSYGDKLRAELHDTTDHGGKLEIDTLLALAVLIVTKGPASSDDRTLAFRVLRTWGRNPPTDPTRSA